MIKFFDITKKNANDENITFFGNKNSTLQQFCTYNENKNKMPLTWTVCEFMLFKMVPNQLRNYAT